MVLKHKDRTFFILSLSLLFSILSVQTFVAAADLGYNSNNIPRLEAPKVSGQNTYYYNNSNVTNIITDPTNWSQYPATSNINGVTYNYSSTGNLNANGSGSFATGINQYDTSTGAVFRWMPSKYSFVAGFTNTNVWNLANVGLYSASLGYNNNVSGDAATSFGSNNIASGASSFTAGSQNIASGTRSIAIGDLNFASARGASALGSRTDATGQYSSSFGRDTTASGQSSFVTGENSIASGTGATAIGLGATADGQFSTVIGQSVSSGGNTLAIVFGSSITATEPESFNVGFDSILFKVNKTATYINSLSVTQNITSTGKICDSVGCIGAIYNISTATTCGQGWEYGDVKMSNNSINYNCWKVANSSDGTIDLRDRFIVGAGTTNYTIGATGGEAMHNLTIDEMPTHTHTYSRGILGTNAQTPGTFTFNKGYNTQNTGSTGNGTAFENRPPYYALVYKQCVCN